MTRTQQLAELTSIAKGLKALGKPGHDNKWMASQRLALMERFERLVRSLTPSDRHELLQALKDMLTR